MKSTPPTQTTHRHRDNLWRSAHSTAASFVQKITAKSKRYLIQRLGKIFFGNTQEKYKSQTWSWSTLLISLRIWQFWNKENQLVCLTQAEWNFIQLWIVQFLSALTQTIHSQLGNCKKHSHLANHKPPRSMFLTIPPLEKGVGGEGEGWFSQKLFCRVALQGVLGYLRQF